VSNDSGDFTKGLQATYMSLNCVMEESDLLVGLGRSRRA